MEFGLIFMMQVLVLAFMHILDCEQSLCISQVLRDQSGSVQSENMGARRHFESRKEQGHKPEEGKKRDCFLF